MDNVLISVIMSVYNEKIEWLQESIESILNQTYKNIEFIIVLDNPNNKELDQMIKVYCAANSRIKYFINARNEGIVYSLNYAIKEANGQIIARMDADDIALPNRLENQLKDLQMNHYDIVGSGAIYIDENGEIQGYSTTYGQEYVSCIESLKLRSILLHPTWMIKKSVFETVGYYHDIPAAEDYEWICRAACMHFRMHCLNEYLLKYRIRSSSISSNNSYIQAIHFKEINKEYRRAIHKSDEYISSRTNIFSDKIYNDKKLLQYSKATELNRNASHQIKYGNKYKAILDLLYSWILSPYYFKYFIYTLLLRYINRSSLTDNVKPQL